MTAEERIPLLEKRIEPLSKENHRFRQDQKKVHEIKNLMPHDRWYIAYLQSEMARLELQYEESQKHLNTYQKHYSKWGNFIHDMKMSDFVTLILLVIPLIFIGIVRDIHKEMKKEEDMI